MKSCLICHHADPEAVYATCPKCGEASWGQLRHPEPELALVPTEEMPKKRGPGRPKKDAS